MFLLTLIRACVRACVRRVPVTWLWKNSSALPWHRVTSDGSLVLLQVQLSAQGDYSCWDSQGLLLHAVRLRLGRECPLFTGSAANQLPCSQRPPLPPNAPTGSGFLSGLPFGGWDCFQMSPSLVSVQKKTPEPFYMIYSLNL